VNVLLSAYACEPGRGSEPGVGWNMAKALARRHQVYVLTTQIHQAAIDAELAAHPDPNLHFTYVDPFGWKIDWNKPRAVYLHYYLWQIRAFLVGRKLHRKVGLDVAHHVTYMKYSVPSYCAFLPVPFFMGPVGGGESAPTSFVRELSPKARAYELARDLARRVGELDPFLRLMMRRSAYVWATTEETAARVRKVGCSRVEAASGMALDDDERATLAALPEPKPGPMRFVGMGRLLHWKGFHLAIRALAASDLPDAEYWILGDGPERASLEALAAELGIADRVKFFGQVDRPAALAAIGDCHVFLLPSLHDSGGWVFLEAMAAARPVICGNLGGPPVQVTEECGIRVPAETPEQMVRDLAAAMELLDGNRALCRQMGQDGQHRVAEYLTWDGHAERATRAYTKATTSSGGS
jgi:glycosyltransferase involved in cell wall biosynthesis